jgi:hypothetical protein
MVKEYISEMGSPMRHFANQNTSMMIMTGRGDKQPNVSSEP